MQKENKTDSTVIKRVVKEVKYAQIDNDLINNKELSFKALGIMAYILSKPDDWQIYISDLCRDKDGEKSVRSGLNELKDKKYIQRYRVYDMDTGKVHHWETLVSETPFNDEELISSVKEKYLKNEEGKIINRKIKIKSFERNVPIVIEREVTLLSQKGKVENKNKNFLLSQNVQVENLQVENAGQQILNSYTKTNSCTKTDISNISNNSKGDKSPQALRFEKIINKNLGTSTLPKFEEYVSKYDSDFIDAILDYAEENNARSFSWFKSAIDKYIFNNMLTRKEVELDIERYREEGRKSKNRALKEKDENKNLDNAIETAKERELDEAANKVEDIVPGTEVEEIKEIIKGYVSEPVFKAWIVPNKFLDVDGKIVMVCVNMFSRDTIERRYYNEICTALKENGFNGSLFKYISC